MIIGRAVDVVGPRPGISIHGNNHPVLGYLPAGGGRPGVDVTDGRHGKGW